MDNRKQKIENITELYKRILPALKTKVDELKREKVVFVSELDVWNYCIDLKWKKKKGLRIYEMVDDVLNIDAGKIQEYIKNKIINRNIIEEDEFDER